MNIAYHLRKTLCVGASICLLGGSNAFACLWEYGTDLSGDSVRVHGSFDGSSDNELRRYSFLLSKARQNSQQIWESKERELSESLKVSSDYTIKSDYAVALVHLGKYDAALAIFKDIESSNPGTYINAANLGTTYELQGDLSEALSWIREGITRNVGAHRGTEWLHVKILEARIALKSDPTALSGKSIVGLNFGDGVRPKMPNSLASNTAEISQILSAIEYQLQERVQFVKPPDAVVANLLFDLSNLVALTHTLEDAVGLLAMAEEYGYTPLWTITLRRWTYEGLINWPLFFFVALFAAIVLGWRRRGRKAQIAT